MTDIVTNLGLKEIQSILPHRYPFLFLDKVIELRRGEFCRAVKNISGNEDFLQGHFPGNPVVPGVIIIEALAQAGGILIYYDVKDENKRDIFFAGIEKTRFRAPILPGDQVILETTLRKQRLDLWIFDACALVDDKVVVDTQLKIIIR